MRFEANGISLYCKKCGSGSPVILLHGNGENHEIFDGLIELLCKNHTVYALDSRCHGKSDTGELTYENMASDVAELIKIERIESPIVYGFSDGGIVGLLLAINYPEIKLGRLIISGANLNPKGMKFYARVGLRIAYMLTKSDLVKLMLTQPNILVDELQKIDVPTLLTAGQHDMIKSSHTKLIANGIKNSKLVIVKGHNHQSYVFDNNILYSTILDFLPN